MERRERERELVEEEAGGKGGGRGLIFNEGCSG